MGQPGIRKIVPRRHKFLIHKTKETHVHIYMYIIEQGVQCDTVKSKCIFKVEK